jgi:predicted transcriptional regulator
MVNQNLIEEIDETESKDKRTNKVYKVTVKGDSVISYFNHAKAIIEVEEPEFNPFNIPEA